jgi:hypothetical protein
MPLNEAVNVPACGACGRPMGASQADGDRGGGSLADKRVNYVIVGIRGGIAEFREAGCDSTVRKTDAAMLAYQLKVDQASLPGRRFSCRVEPAEYGVVRSDFELRDDEVT